jgi:soluble lytic murein transglycosylase-like protein
MFIPSYLTFASACLFTSSAAAVCSLAELDYKKVAREYAVPPAVLYAIALTESGGALKGSQPWPWTLNVAGKGYYYATREQAYQALNAYLNDGKQQIDVGLMQINWQCHYRKLQDPWTALDPNFNLRLGASLLAEQLHVTKNIWKAVGRYHSPGSPRRAAWYSKQVSRRHAHVVNQVASNLPTVSPPS